MSLQFWFPLNGDMQNYGLSNIQAVYYNVVINDNGKIGQCGYFSGERNYMRMDSIFSSDTQEFSYACWFKLGASTTGGLFSCRIYPSNVGLSVSVSSSNIYFVCGQSFSQAQSLTEGVWYHLACTYKKNDKCVIYLNGEAIYTSSVGSLSSSVSTRSMFIGALQDSGDGVDRNYLNGSLNDVRIYDHTLSAKEVKEIASGLVLHYKLNSQGSSRGNPNLGNTSANYSNVNIGYPYPASKWGGDDGTVTYYNNGGYNNLPYKVYHRTATGTGGIHRKTANDITLEAGKTYTMSCWIKASRNFTENAYAFNINRGSDNYYINYGANIAITTEWQFLSKTFTTTNDMAGSYGEMGIIYNDNVIDYYVYYSGFKIEEGSIATQWNDPDVDDRMKIYDSSGYRNDGTVIGNIISSIDTPKYDYSLSMNNTSTSNHIECDKEVTIPTEAITASIWVKTASKATNQVIFAHPLIEFGTLNSLGYVRPNSNTAGFTLNNFVNDAWNHIVVIRQNTTFKLYVNGVLETQSGASNNYTHSGTALWLLNRNYNNNYAGNAMVSDFRLYSTALTDAQILELYNTSASMDKNNIYTRELVEI